LGWPKVVRPSPNRVISNWTHDCRHRLVPRSRFEGIQAIVDTPWKRTMNAVAFDTLKFAQALRDKANMSPTQAEGISQAFSEAIAGQLATRDDLANLATAARRRRTWPP
jgi:hypothetical protein